MYGFGALGEIKRSLSEEDIAGISTFTQDLVRPRDLFPFNQVISEHSIYLDNVDTGYVTPKTLNGITAGSHIVKCVKTGYNDQAQTISVSADQTTNVQMTLTQVQQEVYHDHVHTYWCSHLPGRY